MISLHILHSHVYYEEVYEDKRSQNFSIKTLTLTTIVCPNFKNKQKTGLNTLEVKISIQQNVEHIKNLWHHKNDYESKDAKRRI